MKLGIVCVYYFEEEDGWVQDLQLDQIARNTEGDFTLYAATNRLWPSLKKKLTSHDFVTVVNLPTCKETGAREHGAYLDMLIEHAIADGCTHITTLDCDSFPISKGWAERLKDSFNGEERLAAVFRAENFDTFLPHPCGCFFEASFAKDLSPICYPPEAEIKQAAFQKFLSESGQRVDTGIGFAHALWESSENWVRLYRSNKRDDHRIMSGIYGDTFFHIGATSRAPVFASDYKTNPVLRWARRLEKLPLVWRVCEPIYARYRNKNKKTMLNIRRKLTNDPSSYIDWLRGL